MSYCSWLLFVNLNLTPVVNDYPYVCKKKKGKMEMKQQRIGKAFRFKFFFLYTFIVKIVSIRSLYKYNKMTILSKDSLNFISQKCV